MHKVDFFFFNDTATTEIYTLSLHDALPIFSHHMPEDVLRSAIAETSRVLKDDGTLIFYDAVWAPKRGAGRLLRSKEHTSELQSRQYLVCRLLLEKKKKNNVLSHTPLSHCSS